MRNDPGQRNPLTAAALITAVVAAILLGCAATAAAADLPANRGWDTSNRGWDTAGPR